MLAVLLAGTFAATVAAQAQTTWYVDDDALNDPGPGDPTVSDPNEDGSVEHPFDAIQEAIFVCQDGDTVLVADGTYTGLWNKDLDFGGLPITVRSENGPDNCIIDCEGEGRALQCRFGEDSESVVDGFTMTDGHVSQYGGGAIFCYNASSPTIKNCVITNNCAASFEEDARGGGIYCLDYSCPTFIDCTITHNTASASSTPDVDGRARGGGMHFDQSSPTFINCAISGNTATGTGNGNSVAHGGGIYSFRGSPTFVNCKIDGNTARGFTGSIDLTYSHGGGLYGQESSVTLANCTINANQARSAGSSGFWAGHNYGGAICNVTSTLTVVNCTIAGNTANPSGLGSEGQGGGIYNSGSADATVASSVLWGDSATDGTEIALVGPSCESTVRYSNVEGAWASVYIDPGSWLDWGEGNIFADPLFVDPDGPDDDPNTWEDNDYHL